MKRIKPKKGQESVWDYPRPPIVESSSKSIQIFFNKVCIVETNSAKRVLETSHPPVYYVPPSDVKMQYLQESDHSTWCEFKGGASYYHIKIGDEWEKNAAWYYKASTFPELNNHIAFYPSKMDACYVNDEKVLAQEGDFYGGWVTSDIVGPFKGAPGTWGW